MELKKAVVLFIFLFIVGVILGYMAYDPTPRTANYNTPTPSYTTSFDDLDGDFISGVKVRIIIEGNTLEVKVK